MTLGRNGERKVAAEKVMAILCINLSLYESKFVKTLGGIDLGYLAFGWVIVD